MLWKVYLSSPWRRDLISWHQSYRGAPKTDRNFRLFYIFHIRKCFSNPQILSQKLRKTAGVHDRTLTGIHVIRQFLRLVCRVWFIMNCNIVAYTIFLIPGIYTNQWLFSWHLFFQMTGWDKTYWRFSIYIYMCVCVPGNAVSAGLINGVLPVKCHSTTYTNVGF